MASPAEIITQLNSARDIVLKDPSIYPQVVPGVVPVIGNGAHVELRRWGSDFLAEAFASPVVTADAKQSMCLKVLDTLRAYLNRKEELGEEEDPSVMRSTIQCVASIYPYVFRHTISTPSDSETWGKMTSIKSGILRRLDTAQAGIRMCCIKFVARVVQVQTPGLISDPRRSEQNEISLALVPRDHPVFTPSNLEAEASGLLDRLLGFLQDDRSDALIVTATLNAMAAIVQRRPSVAQKILSAVMTSDPLAFAGQGHMSGKDKVTLRSITRTTIAFMINSLKRNPNNPMAGRLQQSIERLRHGLDEAFSARATKRPAPDEPSDGLDASKRQRVEAAAVNGTQSGATGSHGFPELPSGPISYAQLFTLSHDPAATSFHVEAIPVDIVNRLIPPLLQHIDAVKLDSAINAIRKRYLDLSRQAPATATEVAKAVVGDDEDDDYDPSAEFSEAGGARDVLDQAPPAEEPLLELDIGPFSLPTPPPITPQERDEYSRLALTRVFGTLTEFDRRSRAKDAKNPETDRGLGRLSTSVYEREGWITLLTRLATRTQMSLNETSTVHSTLDKQLIKNAQRPFELAHGIRQALLKYVQEDFRRRIDVAIAWLNEEWYSDRLHSKEREGDASNGTSPDRDNLPHYWPYMLRVLDSMTPYLDIKDSKTLIRFLSEVPQLNQQVMDRLRALANDPEKVTIITHSLLYLSMFRPPIREMALDTVERLWRENSDARTSAAKILTRYRPHVLTEAKVEVKMEA